MKPQLTRQHSQTESEIRVRFSASVGHQAAQHQSPPFQLDVDLVLPGQGITVVFGASGSGKTTLLRCIAGLQAADQGELIVNGETWHDHAGQLPAHQRSVGYVFQEASLFEHLNAEDNLRYAIARADRKDRNLSPRHIIELMGIESVLPQKPAQLSGGERQRVAIARALLINPGLLLMDEPLAALDTRRRQEILPYLERLHKEIQLPVIYVTHSMEEVTRLADYLVILEQGRVAVAGELADVLARTDLPSGVGEDSGTVLAGHIVERDSRWHLVRVRFPGGDLLLRDTGSGGKHNDEVRLRVLARDVSLSLDAEQRSSILNRLPAEVAAIDDSADPAMATVQLKIGESVLLSRVPRRSVAELQLQVGQAVWAQIRSVEILR